MSTDELTIASKPAVTMLASGMKTRGIYLGEKIRAVYEASRGLRHPRREKRPWQEGSEAEERVGNSLRRHLGEVAEEHGEHDRRQDWLKECPRNANRRLLVTHRDIAEGEVVEQFPLFPHVG